MFMRYNLPTKHHNCLNNAVNKQLSTHFDFKMDILIMQLFLRMLTLCMHYYSHTNHTNWLNTYLQPTIAMFTDKI